eukprot:Hpha_TRINITY_DN16472_c0_g4::TRINITY_DN16472_c0_g4_i11::g.160713::m.160713
MYMSGSDSLVSALPGKLRCRNHLRGDQLPCDLLLSHHLLLQQDVDEGFARLVGDGGRPRAVLVPDARQESSDNADGVVDQCLAVRFVGLDLVDAGICEGGEGRAQHVDGVQDSVDHDGLHHIQLQLSGVRGHSADGVRPDDTVRAHRDHLGNVRVVLTRNQTRLRLHARQPDLPEPGPRTRAEQTEVVADLRHLQRNALEYIREGEHTGSVGRRLDQVLREGEGDTGHLRKTLHRHPREVPVSAQTRTDRSTAQVAELEVFGGDPDDINIIFDGARQGEELLPQSHWHRVLELSTPHLDDMVELYTLRAEGLGDLGHCCDQLRRRHHDGQPERSRVGVVCRLRLVDVVVRVNVFVGTLLVPKDLIGTVRNDFVGVHVGRGSCTALDHVRRELVCKLTLDNLVACTDNGVSLLL